MNASLLRLKETQDGQLRCSQGIPLSRAGEDEWEMLGKSQTDPFFPSPPKGAHSHVMLGKQPDQSPRDKAPSKGSQPVAFPNPAMYFIKRGG